MQSPQLNIKELLYTKIKMDLFLTQGWLNHNLLLEYTVFRLHIKYSTLWDEIVWETKS